MIFKKGRNIFVLYLINIFFLQRPKIKGDNDLNENQKYFWNKVKLYLTYLDEEYLQKFLIRLIHH